MAGSRKPWGIDDISGFKVPHHRLKKQWDGLMVASPDFDTKHPLLETPTHKGDIPKLISNPRPELGQLVTNLVPPSTVFVTPWVGTPSVVVV